VFKHSVILFVLISLYIIHIATGQLKRIATGKGKSL